MASSGPLYPSSQEAFGGGGAAWSTPAGALGAPDDTYATVSLAATEVGESLALTAPGFAIPADSVIGGVQVDVQAKRTGGAATLYAQLCDGLLGVGEAKSAAVDTSEGTITFGGPSDLWGANLTPDLVNSSGFGAIVQAAAAAASSVVDVDSVGITVTYTAAGTTQKPSMRTNLHIGLGLGVTGGSAASGGSS